MIKLKDCEKPMKNKLSAKLPVKLELKLDQSKGIK